MEIGVPVGYQALETSVWLQVLGDDEVDATTRECQVEVGMVEHTSIWTMATRYDRPGEWEE